MRTLEQPRVIPATSHDDCIAVAEPAKTADELKREHDAFVAHIQQQTAKQYPNGFPSHSFGGFAGSPVPLVKLRLAPRVLAGPLFRHLRPSRTPARVPVETAVASVSRPREHHSRSHARRRPPSSDDGPPHLDVEQASADADQKVLVAS